MTSTTTSPNVIQLGTDQPPALSNRARFVRGFIRNRFAVIGLIIVVTMGLIAIFAPVLTPYDPNKTDYSSILQSPNPLHPLGTDEYGRDLFSRLAHGAQISLVIAFLAQGVTVTIGVVLGLMAGWYGGWVDDVIMRVADGFFAIPSLMFLIVWVAILEPSKESIFIALGIIGWPSNARLMRGQVLVLRETEYAIAAQAMGASGLRIMFQHMLPNAIAPTIVLASLGVAGAILAESTLSFLGLGVKIPNPSWGTMIDIGRNYTTTAWWYAIYPGLTIMLTVLGFNFVGDGLRDALDPKSYR